MGRSQGRNKIANTLLGSGSVNLKDSRNGLRQEQLKIIDYNDNVYNDSPMPSHVEDGQIGISILWPGDRGSLIFAMHPENDNPFASYEDIDDQEILEYLIDQVEQRENILEWVDGWNLSECLDIRFPGQETHSMPKTDDYAVFVSTVLNIDQKKFEDIVSASFPESPDQIASIVEAGLSLQDELSKLEKHLSKSDIAAIFIESTSPLPTRPLKIGFRKQD